MSKIQRASLIALLLSAPAGALAQDLPPDEGTEVEALIATATLDEGGVERELIGGSVSVLTSDDLEQRGTRLVGEVLRDVPGVAVSRLGAIGGLTQVRVRGAESNHTLVLVDGINIADAVDREPDIGALIAEDGARIEVLRGQQSSLYGSEAIGAVIQYFTPDGRTSPGVRARAEYGSFDTFAGSLQAGGVRGGFDYMLSLTGWSTEGTPNTRGGTRDLGAENLTGSVKLHYALNEAWRLVAVARASRQDFDFNAATDATGVLIDSAPDAARTDTLVGKVELQGATMGGRWTHALSLQGLDAASRSTSFGSTFATEGDRIEGAYVTTYAFGEGDWRHKLTGAVDYQRERFSQVFDPVRRDLNTLGLVGVYDLVVRENTAFGASVRNDSNDRFESFTSYRVQATHRLPAAGLRLRAAAGTGIQYPNQFELFGFSGTFLANPNLKPEKSEGWEAGIEKTFNDGKILVGLTYFDNALTDKISSTGFPITTPVNLAGTARQKGVEIFAEAQITDALALDIAYTNLDSTDGVPPTQTIRRPANMASFNLNWSSPMDRVRLNLNVRHSDEQRDNRFPFAPPFVVPVVLSGFTLVNLNGQWKVGEAVTLFARAENLTDETYEEVFSYVSPGRQVTAGLKARF